MRYTQQEYYEINIHDQIIRFPIMNNFAGVRQFVDEKEQKQEKMDLSLPKELFKI